MNVKVTILGSGAWGTALASVAARKGHETILWGRDNQSLKSIEAAHENPAYLPGITLPDNIRTESGLEQSVRGADIVLLVTPAQTISELCGALKPGLASDVPLILCAKGIDRKTGHLPAETAKTILPNPIAALSGPSFATDTASNLPTAVTLASGDIALASKLSEALSFQTFRIYASDDLKGTELGGALKNVIAVAVGVCRGMKLGASAEAALIARGFAELNRLAQALGAKPVTLMGLSGLGDLVLTCSSPQSRNFSYGMALGQSGSVSTMPSNLKLAEGALTAGIAEKIARENKIDTPIIAMVAKLVEGAITAPSALEALLSRPLKKESD